MSLRLNRSGLGVGLLLIVAALVAVGCGSSKNDSASTTSLTSGSASAVPEAIQAKVDAALKGTWTAPPTAAPKPDPGKNVWIISCGQQIPSCSTPTASVQEAAKVIGWRATVADGKFTPTGFSAAIREAIAAKADGIVLVSIDCAAARQAIRDATTAGIKVVALYSMDCNDRYTGGTAEFDASVKIKGTQNYGVVVEQWAAVKADAVIAKTHGNAKVIDFSQPEFLTVRHIEDSFERELKTCSSCKIVDTIPITAADFGPNVTAKIQSALLKHPEANVVEVPYDGLVQAGVGAGIMASGRAKDLFVMGAEGLTPNLDMIRSQSGEEDAAVGFPTGWLGWAAVDTLNSVFRGREPQESGIGWQLIDPHHNLPAAGKGWEPTVDYIAAYKKSWGVSR